MPTVNDALFDAAVRHQVWLSRYGGSTARRIIKLLDRADLDLVKIIAARVERLGLINRQQVGFGRVTSERLQILLAEIRVQNRELHMAIGKRLRSDLEELTEIEVDIASRRLDEAIGVDLGNLRPSPELLRATVTTNPIRGRLLRDWVKELESFRIRDIRTAIQLGLVEGETTPQIIRLVREAGRLSRPRAEGIVRTSVNHVANRARNLLYQANDDIVRGERWTSTLDSGTTPICRARDGLVFKLGQGPRPPAHINCRSVMTPVLRSWDELARPGALKRARGANNIDALFDRQLAAKGFSKAERATIKRNTRSSMNGAVPESLTYQSWLKRQPAGFQDDVLGKSKGQLFRKGRLPLDRFVDRRTGREFTLAELRKRERTAWARAGLPKETAS